MWPLQQPWFFSRCGGEQAPAEPSDWCCGREEPGSVETPGGTPEAKALPNPMRLTQSENSRVATSRSRPRVAYASPHANISRTSWRSSMPGIITVRPRGTDRSSLPARHNLRPHGFLLRTSTAGPLQLAFVVRRRLQGACNGSRRSAGSLRSFPRCATGPPGVTVGPRWRSVGPHSTRAKLSVPHLTPGCSGLAALAAEPIG